MVPILSSLQLISATYAKLARNIDPKKQVLGLVFGFGLRKHNSDFFLLWHHYLIFSLLRAPIVILGQEGVDQTNAVDSNRNEEHDFLPWVQDHYSDDFTYHTASASKDASTTSSNYESTTISLLCVTLCICTAALAAGLTLGMMSIDPLFLAIKYRSGTVDEKRQASQILPLVKQHHFLLVTLLLMNSLANEALPVFLNHLVPDYVAVLLSVTLVLFFGEIIPSAIFTGPDQMSIAATLVPIVKIVMIVLSPIAYPISLLLDKVLHPNDNNNHGATSHDYSHLDKEDDADDSLDIVDFNREEIKALIRIQYEQGLKAAMKDKKKQKGDNISNSFMKRSVSLPPLQRHNSLPATPKATPPRRNSHHERVLSDEVELVEGALTLANRTIRDVCIPLHCVFVLDRDTTLLDLDTMAKIYSCGFSRIPVVVTPPHHSPSFPHKSTTMDQPNEYTPLSRTATPYNDKARICGVLLTRQLILINPNDQRPLSELPLLQPLCVSPDLSILHMLQLFLKGSTHMAIVCQNPEIASLSLRLKRPIPHTTVGVLGIITLEDVLEELIKEEIYDETDIKARNISGQRIYSAMISATNKRNRKNKADQQQQKAGFDLPSTATINARSTPALGVKKASSQPKLYDTTATYNDSFDKRNTATSTSTTTIGDVIPLSTQVSNLTVSSEEEASEALNIFDRYL